MLMPVTPAIDAVQTQKNISAEPTYEFAINAQNYLQGVFYELPNEKTQTEDVASMDEEQSQNQAAAVQVNTSVQEPATPAVEAEPKRTLLGTYRLTAYCPCQKCCGKSPSDPGYGITACGAKAEEGITVAMAGLPFGTRIYIEGLGERIVQDRGVSNNIIDIFIASHERCFNSLYNRSAQVWILE
jgi:3D (Asp-Asp-Asp) domain-containing protein